MGELPHVFQHRLRMFFGNEVAAVAKDDASNITRHHQTNSPTFSPSPFSPPIATTGTCTLVLVNGSVSAMVFNAAR
jgi:hypothetical protein